MKNMIGYNVRKDEGLLLKGRLVVALEKELNGVETQERSNLIDNINMIYQKKMDICLLNTHILYIIIF